MGGYKVLISDEPIPFGVVGRLRDLGLVVPFLVSDVSFNIYAYVPDGVEVDMDRVGLVYSFHDNGLWISSEEFDRFNARILDYNVVVVGDLVTVRGYGDLVCEVISVEGDVVVVEIILRGERFVINSVMSDVCKSVKSYGEDVRDFSLSCGDAFYVDLGEFDDKDGVEYVSAVINFLFRLKLLFKGVELVLVGGKCGVGGLLGLREVNVGRVLDIGLVGSFVGDGGYFYSRDCGLLSDRYRFVSIFSDNGYLSEVRDDNIYVLTGLNSFHNYDIYNEFRSLGFDGYFDESKVKRDINYDNVGFIHKYDLDGGVEVVGGEFEVVENGFSYDSFVSYLLDNDIIFVLENVDFYLETIRCG